LTSTSWKATLRPERGGIAKPFAAMSKILISYRREDSADVTGRIDDRLVQQFGREAVFVDVDSIPFGVDFRKHLDEQVAKCDVFLAVIGPDWMGPKDSQGKTRLDDPRDFVRIEIESALTRQIPVIPLLVRGGSIPSAEQLPQSLRELPYRHGLPVRSGSDFHNDMSRLITYLAQNIRGFNESQPKQEVTSKSVQREAKPSAPVAPVDMVKVPQQARSFSEPQPKLDIPAKPVQEKSKQSASAAPVDMVKVPKGPFLYGDEKTRVTIDHDYWIDKYPVTNQKYRAFMEAGGYENQTYWSSDGWQWKAKEGLTSPKYWNDLEWNKADRPVVGVSYYEAEAYAKWARKRLPREKEWEKAVRGEDGRQYPWGEEFDKTRCNSNESGIGHTTAVILYPNGVSPYGCYDMAGNVWEWCADRDTQKGGFRVIRGGSWNCLPVNLRASNRLLGSAAFRLNDIGFRLVQDIEP
jgi:formylglycine-generating enzyme required for sulfatase activity